MSTHNMFSLRNKKNIMWIPPLICSYVIAYWLYQSLSDWVTLFADLDPYCSYMVGAIISHVKAYIYFNRKTHKNKHKSVFLLLFFIFF